MAWMLFGYTNISTPKCVCWECHPDLVHDVKEHIQFFPEIELVDKAVWSERTTLEFNIVVNGNVGALKCFQSKKRKRQTST